MSLSLIDGVWAAAGDALDATDGDTHCLLVFLVGLDDCGFGFEHGERVAVYLGALLLEAFGCGFCFECAHGLSEGAVVRSHAVLVRPLGRLLFWVQLGSVARLGGGGLGVLGWFGAESFCLTARVLAQRASFSQIEERPRSSGPLGRGGV